MLKFRLLVCVLCISSITAIEAQAAPLRVKASDKVSQVVPTKNNQDSAEASNNTAENNDKASEQKQAGQIGQNEQNLIDRAATMKDLYNKGLISRKEFEQSQQALDDAKKLINAALNQYASTSSASVDPDNSSDESDAKLTEAVWSTGSSSVDGYIKTYANMYDVDPYLIYCVVDQESHFKSGATSGKGARGLMQLMPKTAARYGVKNAYSVEQNIKAGVHYLKDLLTRFHGDNSLALAGYNAGEGAVMKYGNRVPPYSETQNYVKKITAHYRAKKVKKVASKPKTAPVTEVK